MFLIYVFSNDGQWLLQIDHTPRDPEFMGSNPIKIFAFWSPFVVLLFINLVSLIRFLKEVNLYLRGEK